MEQLIFKKVPPAAHRSGKPPPPRSPLPLSEQAAVPGVMADRQQLVVAVGAGEGAVARGEVVGGAAGDGVGAEAGAGAGGRRAPGAARVCTTHMLPWKKPNPNHHQKPVDGKSKKNVKEEDFQEITLTRKFRVDDEGVNFQNEKLIKIFNDLIKIGQRYSEITKVVGKKQTNEMEILKNNFAEVVKKVKPQEAAVIKSGGQPFPLPGPMFSKLPNELKHLMKVRGRRHFASTDPQPIHPNLRAKKSIGEVQMAGVAALRRRSLWAAASCDDAGFGAGFGLEGLNLSEAAVVDKEGLVKGRPAAKEEVAAPAIYESKSKAGDGRNVGEKAADAVAESGGEGNEAPAWNGLWKLPDEEVQWVLSWKRTHLTSGEVPADGVEAFEALGDTFEEYQKWMRREYEENGGVVLVDDDYVARREEHYKWVKELVAADEELAVEWDESDIAYWNISDRLSDFYDSDVDDEEEVAQEAETN
ncbi:hypothetical protein EJB05_55223 [Eragrostis curvula]|uniref:Uncharacterized protein n=1 Tax=Eragrostis curvula TaxID=38414 RepID=A0A5J9SKB2_9POAL|nr:hypothetical protein EJB05_55223 [Eragrostis curvula]